MTQNLLSEIKIIDEAGSTSGALNLMYNSIDTLMINSEYGAVDSLLAAIEVKNFSVAMLIGFLTITLQWRSKLDEREMLFERIQLEVERKFPPEKSRRLLSGLE